MAAMFIGHYALGMAAKRLEPKRSLGQLLSGSQLLDMIWPVLVLAGIEHVEMFATGVIIYARATVPRDRAGTWSFCLLAAFLLITYLGSSFGPLPPSAKAVAASGLALWLIPLWGASIDRHRENKAGS